MSVTKSNRNFNEKYSDHFNVVICRSLQSYQHIATFEITNTSSYTINFNVEQFQKEKQQFDKDGEVNWEGVIRVLIPPGETLLIEYPLLKIQPQVIFLGGFHCEVKNKPTGFGYFRFDASLEDLDNKIIYGQFTTVDHELRSEKTNELLYIFPHPLLQLDFN